MATSINMGKTKGQGHSFYQRIAAYFSQKPKETQPEPATPTQRVYIEGTITMQELVEYNSPELWALMGALPEWYESIGIRCDDSPTPISMRRIGELEEILGYKPKSHADALVHTIDTLNSPRFVPLKDTQGIPYADDSIPSKESAAAVVEAVSAIPTKDNRIIQTTEKYTGPTKKGAPVKFSM